MSSYYRDTKHPLTGKVERAYWIDDFFGRHRYGVQFSDGRVFRPSEIELAESTGADGDQTEEHHNA